MLLSRGMRTLRPILLALTAVAALLVAYPAKANLITNGGFETGDFTGWTHLGGLVVGTFEGVSPHGGSFQAEFDAISFLNQSVATTSGTSYTISFALALTQVGGANSFSLSWGGVTIFSLTNHSAFGYTVYTFTETASTASTALQFNINNQVEGGSWVLDDVSVTPTGVGVPDGGTTVSLLGCALLGLAGLRRKLGC